MPADAWGITDAYDDALEDLLVQLARKAKTIRELEGRKS